jgi:hypothetical protein
MPANGFSLLSPVNRGYGGQVQQRFCWNGQSALGMQACLQGAPVWYSDWGYQEAGKIHARLTFNPYFDWQMSVIMTVLSDQSVRSSHLSPKSHL